MSIGRNVPKNTAGSDCPALQYANGKTVYRGAPGAGRFGPLVGWHIEAGRDEGLDAALHHAGNPRIEIKHQREGGSEILPHWFLGEAIRFFPVTSGPPYTSVAALVRGATDTADAGLGVKWAQGERSRLAVRGYVNELARVGYDGLVQLGVRSKMTDVLLGALLDHLRVCEAADALVDRAKHPDVVALHEIALPLGPGEEEEWGKGDATTVVPFRSMHPETVDGAYLTTVWRPPSMHQAAIAAWEGILEWARGYATEREAY